MGTDQSQIFIAQMARVFLAPLGTIAPIDATVALDPDWREAGLFTPDSLQFTDTPQFDTVTSHQSAWPTRRFQKGEDGAVQVDLQQFSSANMTSVFGGGTLIEIVPPDVGPPAVAGQYKWSPPAIGARLDVAAILQLADGPKQFRIVIPRSTNTDAVATQFRKTNETLLPLRLALVGADVGDAYYYLTNDPAWAPTAP